MDKTLRVIEEMVRLDRASLEKILEKHGLAGKLKKLESRLHEE